MIPTIINRLLKSLICYNQTSQSLFLAIKINFQYSGIQGASINLKEKRHTIRQPSHSSPLVSNKIETNKEKHYRSPACQSLQTNEEPQPTTKQHPSTETKFTKKFQSDSDSFSTKIQLYKNEDFPLKI